ncbi:hypothetical protein BT93_E2391 [Corymbia citriodora subsp. variegata]|nr:hypothetical protein BT93_E2391 [Corymbia citriodora subsp. variegata]
MEPASPPALLLFAAVGFLGIAASTARIHSGNVDSYYGDHCGDVVPGQPPIASELASSYGKLLQFQGGFFSADGGRRAESGHDLRRAVLFTPMAVHRTKSEDVISLQGTLVFADPNVNAIFGNPKNRRLREFHVRGPRIPVRRGTVKFRLNGYWSRSSDVGFLPKAMSFTSIQCSDHGEWDSKANRWCAVACRILNFSTSLADAFAGDCSIKLCWRFPATFSVANRYPVVGQMWSNETVKDFGYFDKIKFWGHNDALPGVKYKYGVRGSVRKPCESKTRKHKGKRYPNPYSSDMRFDMSIKNIKGQKAHGYSSPLFVGDKRFNSPFHLYGDSYMLKANRTENAVQLDSTQSPLQNISYTMRFTPSVSFELGGENISSKAVDIFAEGTYNNETGHLCMMGCRYVTQSGAEVYKNGSMDCEIQINIQLHPLTGKGNEEIKGTIESTRARSDPLYFGKLDLVSSSIYVEQANESIWRMDLEIVIVLVSNTLACVFVGLQLFHVKKQPEVLPFISITMLIVLTLGHMIPLLLNFEALVTNHNRQSVFLGSGGWLEVNEVIVRVVTMIAFLLELYLLHMTWSARYSDDNPKGLWVSEKKVIFVSLPMYISSGLIAWFIHQSRKSHRSPFLRQGHLGYTVPANQLARYQPVSFWGDLKSYAGLILDGFLLPQLLFNLFFDSSVEALSRSYYVGTTIVRLVPHAYDLYRAHSSAWNLDLSYIYANPRMDFYSTAWDIIIPFSGLVFAVFIYLQQRFGGRCILPKRFRGTPVYEKVPTVGTIEL